MSTCRYLVGWVGKDDSHYASLLQPVLQNGGVITTSIEEIAGSQTGSATVLVEQTGENGILYVPGANYASLSDMRNAVEKLSIDTEPSVIIMQGELPRDGTFETLRYCANSKSQIIFNPAPVYPEGIPAAVLELVDFLVLNETQCKMFANDLAYSPCLPDNGDQAMSVTEVQKVAEFFHKVIGVQNLLITLGPLGVFCSSQEGETELVSGVHVDTVIDTTAAGDTFIGYFAIALARHMAAKGTIENFNLVKAAKRANAAAAICIQREGAMKSIPFGYEIDCH